MRGTFNSFNWHDLDVQVRLEKADENALCIKLEKIVGDKMEFLDFFDKVRLYLIAANCILAEPLLDTCTLSPPTLSYTA